FLPACGVTNVPHLVSILIGWGLDYKAVFDDDPGAGRKAYNLLKKNFYENDDDLAHEHILKITDCNGIEDILSPSDFYKYVLNKSVPESGPASPNSKLVGDKKELYGRMFLDNILGEGEVILNSDSIQKIETIFEWIYDKFAIT
ncbi:hypothetical protein COB64_04050, partial [Candidatus Wolfebacteria bacterium]